MAESQSDRNMKEEVNSAQEDALFAGLPASVGLSIMARLPCLFHPCLRCVCRAWNDAFQSSGSVISYRRALGMLQAWPLIRIRRANKPCRWFVLNPHHLSSHRIPSPPSIHIEQVAGRALCMFATYRFDMCKSLHFHSFDASGMQWHHSQVPRMRSKRSFFACAIVDDYWYVVGGCTNDPRSVERIHIGNPSMLLSWEQVTNMHDARVGALAISWQGCLYVLGGRRQYTDEHTKIYSGEVWNPRKEEWTLVPQLWPFEVFGNHLSDQIAVAVAMGALFALKMSSKQLLCYHDGKQEWVILGHIPLDSNKRFRKLLGVGSELWLFSRCDQGPSDADDFDAKGVFWYEICMFDVASVLRTLSDTPPNLLWRTSHVKFDGEMDMFEHSVVHM